MPSSTPLPQRENQLFKRILKCYEQKQYKNGLKFAKQILSNSKYSEHGETLAMKGLTLNCLGRKDEAYDHVRRGLRNDLRSHVCWHVYGLLQRSDRKYDEAIKCYRNALKWDKENLQILRDLSLLQIQMRDLEGYRETRFQLLQLRPNQRACWIGYAMSLHLLRSYDMALSVLEEFRKTQNPKPHDYEYSELVLYQNQVMREAEVPEKALKHLEKHQKQICDLLASTEIKGELLLRLGRRREAEAIYRSLIERNPENWAYYQGLEAAALPPDGRGRLELYAQLAELYPRADALKRLPLKFTSGETFRRLLDQYLRRGIRKGMPSLFINIKALYKDAEKVAVIQCLVDGYLQAMKQFGAFSEEDASRGVSEETTVTLWTLFFLIQHYDYLGQTRRAMELLEMAIDHTPTLIDLFVLKARVYKHGGSIEEAAQWMDEAQDLDTADRYINYKCAKYMLRACRVKDAEDMCSKFTREGVPAADSLNEMQCMWFQTECALSYQRQEQWGEALKKCHEVDRHFTEISEDQFDFHTYCMRKMTLQSYCSLLRLEDVLRSHPFFFKAAKIAIEIYTHLHDRPVVEEEKEEEVDTENLTPKELKKLRSKQRRAQKKAQQRQDGEAPRGGPGGGGADKRGADSLRPRTADGEPDGPREEELVPAKLVKATDPLDQAIHFLKPIQLLCSDKLDTHFLAYEIYSRKEKLLLMLQSLKRAYRIDSNNDKLHLLLVKFLKAVGSRGDLSEAVRKVIAEEIKKMVPESDPIQFNHNFIERNLLSLPHRLRGAQSMLILDVSQKEQAISLAIKLSDELTGRNLQNCTAVLDALRNEFHDEAVAKEYQVKCQDLFPLATAFSTADKSASTINNCNNGQDIACTVDP